jgi:hypothetical protein
MACAAERDRGDDDAKFDAAAAIVLARFVGVGHTPAYNHRQQ